MSRLVLHDRPYTGLDSPFAAAPLAGTFPAPIEDRTGRLRPELDASFHERVVASLDKDLSRLPTRALGDAIRRALPPTAGMPSDG